MIALDIISDPICPWCYIGKAKLDRALEAVGDHPFDIHWRPFQLNPDMPPEGMDRREYLELKFGGREGAVKVYSQIEQAAKDAGVDVDFSLIDRTPNTLDTHRVIRWARTEGNQTAFVTRLFKLYFAEGADISDHQVLINAAMETGLDGRMVQRLLASDADIEETRDEDKKAREMGVQGVPCFLVGGKYAISGAQEPSVWANVIKELAELEAQEASDA